MRGKGKSTIVWLLMGMLIVGLGGFGVTNFSGGTADIGAVGDVLCHFVDENGKLIPSDIEDRLISTPLEKLRAMDNVVGLAAGAQKAEAIRAVLRGGYLDVLITDEPTAALLLKGE